MTYPETGSTSGAGREGGWSAGNFRSDAKRKTDTARALFIFMCAMGKRIIQFAGPVFGVLLFIIAIAVLHHELKAYHYHEIINECNRIPRSAFILAFAFAVLNFLVLGAYEILGFKYIKNSLAWPKILLTSFVAFSFSNNVGFYSISGSAVRFRLYSQFGLSTVDIAKLIAFASGITFWLGLCSICSLVFITQPVTLPPVLHLPFASTRGIGFLFLVPVVAFLIMTAVRKKPVGFRSFEFDMPAPSLTLGLIFFSCLDWIFFGMVLYQLLPAHTVPFELFISVFLTAQVIGLASHVPGGLGIFESMFILFLPQVPVTASVGALLVFRGIYYLLPLGVSAVVLGSRELLLRKRQVGAVARAISQVGSGVLPQIFGIMIFIGGIVLLASGATPAEHQRLRLLMDFMPLPVLEISHFMASILGMLLLLLAWGIYQRRNSAWHFTLYFLAGGALFSLLKGIDYEEAIILTIMFFILLPAGKHFYRKTSFVNDRFSFGWIVAVAIVIASSIWLGFFAYKHVAYSRELWWQFSFTGHASRFLRASVGIVVAFFIFGTVRLLAPLRVKPEFSTSEDVDKIRNILSTVATSTAQLALLGDKSFLLGEKADAFIMYGVSGRSWISMGDPVGNAASFGQLIWEFRDRCDRHGGWPVFYEVSSGNLPMYLDIGLTLLKMGEEARVNLSSFSMEGGSKKHLRYGIKKIEQEGFVFSVVPKEGVEGIIPKLKAVSDDWLAEKKTREKRFSLGFFNEQYLAENPVAVVEKQGEIVAFANLWTTGTKDEVSIDLMRYSKNAPHGVMQYLFSNIILWGKAQGFGWFNLGMAPFSGLDMKKFGTLWNKIGSFLYDHGETIYNFQGLRQFKEKFDPIWVPKYLAVPGGFSLPLILRDVSALISGGLKGVIAK